MALAGSKHMHQFSLLSKSLISALVLIVGSVGLSGCSSLAAARGAIGNEQSLPAENFATNNRIKRHVYAGVGMGSSWMNPSTSDTSVLKVNEKVAVGAQLSLGVDLSRHMAIELHSSDLGSAGLSPSGRVEYNIFGASALLYAGKNRHNYKRQGFSGFGRIGYGFLDGGPIGDIDFEVANQTHVLIGAGLEYMTHLGLGLRAEAISFDKDARYMQLGLVYRFGQKSRNRPVEIAKVAKPAPKPVPTPIPVPAVVVAKKVIAEPTAIDKCKQLTGTLDGVNFYSNSEALTGGAMQALDGVAEKLVNCPAINIEVSAHTDSFGAEDYNKKLSGRRAASVAKYLFDRGIGRSRLNARAFGETKPIDSNDTPEGRERNRRVELRIVK